MIVVQLINALTRKYKNIKKTEIILNENYEGIVVVPFFYCESINLFEQCHKKFYKNETYILRFFKR